MTAVAGLLMVAAPGTAGVRGEEPVARAPLPLKIDDAYREEIEEIVALSPTLRRQLSVIAAAPAHVEVRVSPAQPVSFRRAETTISRYESGYIRAQVLVPPGVDFIELLAHELEHIVEQIEGVDLTALARTGAASRDANGIFETVRARDAGRAAALEVEEGIRAQNSAH